ncbi:hypothetical protein, partial [Dyella sp.]|uniref:hypothetical protein n=1 Tax=Dyella sp. TaxID=1869338 RepID=UPI002B481553
MMLLTFFEELRGRNIRLDLDDKGNIRVIGPRDRMDAALLAEMKEKKADIVQWLRSKKRVSRPEIQVAPQHSDYAPTSFAQQRLWFVDQLAGSVPYNMPGAWRIRGTFDEQVAERALHRI